MTENPREKWTIPLRDCDIQLWKDGCLISHSAGLDALLKADSAIVCLAHTKNGTKGAVVHHSRGRGPIFPVAAMARRVANIQVGPAQGKINIVYPIGGASLGSPTATLGLWFGGVQQQTNS